MEWMVVDSATHLLLSHYMRSLLVPYLPLTSVSKHRRPVCQVAASEGFTRDLAYGGESAFYKAFCQVCTPKDSRELLTLQKQHSKRYSAFGREKYKLESKCEEHGPLVESREEHGAIALCELAYTTESAFCGLGHKKVLLSSVPSKSYPGFLAWYNQHFMACSLVCI